MNWPGAGHEGARPTGRKTIYVRPNDEPLWEQAEREAGTESLSTVLNDALRKHLQGRPAGPADVWLVHSERPVTVDVEPLESGWQIRNTRVR